MKLIKFIEKESKDSYYQILFLSMVSGVANCLLLIIVNHAAEAVSHKEDLTQYFFLYLISFALFIYGQWFAYVRAIITIEGAIYNVGIRLTDKIQRVELAFIENIGSNNLYARLTQNDTLISQAIPQITIAAQAFIVVLSAFLYLIYISPLTFGVSILALAAGILLFFSLSRLINNSLRKVEQKESDYFQSIAHLVNGFKEVKINKKKGGDIFKKISKESNETKFIKMDVSRQEIKIRGFGRIFIYAVLPVVVFILPSFNEEHVAHIFKITTTLLFMASPMTSFMNAIPFLNRVNIAIADMVNLENDIDQAISMESDEVDRISPDFKEIKIDNVCFSYPNNSAAFSAGPFNQTIVAGELLFIMGGNGSGKSTFLKLLTGLYYPVKGQIQVDSIIIDKIDYTSYRNLFATVFTDFYLFDKFYGIEDIDTEKVNYWLKKMKMERKVKYHKGGFANINLSTGQRKRLAFIAAMLEDKPILVLDEFAADQEPGFRKYFYETVLMELKNKGKTVIVVTHDEHYLGVADRILKMNEGNFE